MPYKIGDLVWAKMKGFCPWPAKICNPPSDKKTQKKVSNQHYVYFFGSKNYGYIREDNIRPYLEFKLEMMNNSKASKFKQAVDDIEDYINQPKASNKTDNIEGSVKKNKKQVKTKKTNPTLDKALAVAAKELNNLDIVPEVKTEAKPEKVKTPVKAENDNKENCSMMFPSLFQAVVKVEVVRMSRCAACAQVFADGRALQLHAKAHRRKRLDKSDRKKISRRPKKFSTPKIRLNHIGKLRFKAKNNKKAKVK